MGDKDYMVEVGNSLGMDMLLELVLVEKMQEQVLVVFLRFMFITLALAVKHIRQLQMLVRHCSFY